MKQLFRKKKKKSRKKEPQNPVPLPAPPVAPSDIPQEQDRKALLGCWATIIAYSNTHYTQISEIGLGRSDQVDTANLTKKKRVQAELDQHLRRRYQFHCDLLLSAGQSLELDTEYVTALLPLLEHLSRRDGEEAQDDVPSPTEDKRKGFRNGQKKDDNKPDFFSHEDLALERIQKALYMSKPFLEAMTEGAGFQCIAIILIKSILNASYGYDARYRSDIKRLATIVFLHEQALGDHDLKLEHVGEASNLFHRLENSIGSKLLLLTLAQRIQQDSTGDEVGMAPDQVMRGIQVASVGVVAGTILAVTGGLAAPAIAAGVAGVVGTSIATSSIVVSLTSTTAITAIFGLGGGTYVAHKMHRRTEGLTEFELHKEFQPKDDDFLHIVDDAELFSTIAISGWIRDECDFQRPWGVQPTKPPITRRKELLERFYTVHNPARVEDCDRVLREWEDYEEYLWAHLKWKYGCDPDDPFSCRSSKPSLSDLHNDLVERLCVHYKLCPSREVFETLREFEAAQVSKKQPRSEEKEGTNLVDSMHGPRKGKTNPLALSLPLVGLTLNSLKQKETHAEQIEEDEIIQPTHTAGVWEYRSRYYGELYTVRFESELMKDFCDYVRTMVAEETAKHVGAHALKYTVLSSLMSAVALPTVMLKLTDLVDEKMTMVLERADAAGIVLASSLLDCRDAGQRPVVLIGYSFGARVVFSCLRELARCQIEWEKQTQSKQAAGFSREPASVVEDAILMGLPRNLSSSFHLVRQVVAGRFVNCFSSKDWFMAMLWQVRQTAGLRLNNVQRPFAATSPIDVPGIENIDVSDLVEIQSDYCDVQNEILKRVRLGHPAY